MLILKHLLPLCVVGALLAPHGVATAQFKCVDPQGRTSFQQTPCKPAQKQEALNLRSTPPPAAASGAETPDQRLARRSAHQRRINELETEVQRLETAIEQRSAAMAREIQLLQQRQAGANNNVAGSTYLQALATEMQAVAAKYKALNDIDVDRLKTVRGELDTARKSNAGR